MYDLYEELNLNSLGTLMGIGETTSVIKVPYFLNTSNIESPVLHITRESEKFDYLSNLFEGTDVEIEKVDVDNVWYEYKELFEYLDLEGFALYYTTEMIPEKFEYSLMDEIMVEVCKRYHKDRFSTDSLPVKQLMNEFKYSIGLTVVLKESEQKILDAIEKSLKTVALTQGLYNFKLDFHSEQFCSHNGKLFCIDPVFFGEI